MAFFDERKVGDLENESVDRKQTLLHMNWRMCLPGSDRKGH